MPRLSEAQRGIAIGMLAAGTPVSVVAGHFHVHRNTISSLNTSFRHRGSLEDWPRRGPPRVTTPAQDEYIINTDFQNRFLQASETARNIPG